MDALELERINVPDAPINGVMDMYIPVYAGEEGGRAHFESAPAMDDEKNTAGACFGDGGILM